MTPTAPHQTTVDTADRTAATIDVVERFNAALNAHDPDAVMALMTDDCVFDNTYPPPDGEQFIGQAPIRAFWEGMFASSIDARFEAEELFASDDRCTVRWRYTFTDSEGVGRHIRGADVIRVRDGKVAEKLAYVKG